MEHWAMEQSKRIEASSAAANALMVLMGGMG